MNELLKPYLQQLGLSDKEMLVYLAGLTFAEGQKTLTYAQHTGINRTTTYSVIHELIDKGFMKQSPKRGAKLFYSVSLDYIINTFEEKIDLLKQSLPHIHSLLAYTQDKPQIHYYEGLHNVLREYSQILGNNAEVRAFVGDLQVSEHIKTYMHKIFFPLKVKKGVVSKTIVSQHNEFFPREGDILLRTWRLCPSITIPSNLIINIYGESSIMIVDINEPHHYMLTITSAKIHKFIASLFDLFWNE